MYLLPAIIPLEQVHLVVNAAYHQVLGVGPGQDLGGAGGQDPGQVLMAVQLESGGPEEAPLLHEGIDLEGFIAALAEDGGDDLALRTDGDGEVGHRLFGGAKAGFLVPLDPALDGAGAVLRKFGGVADAGGLVFPVGVTEGHQLAFLEIGDFRDGRTIRQRNGDHQRIPPAGYIDELECVLPEDEGQFTPLICPEEQRFRHARFNGGFPGHLRAPEKGQDLGQDEKENAEDGEDHPKTTDEDEPRHEGVDPQRPLGNAKPLRVGDPGAVS